MARRRRENFALLNTFLERFPFRNRRFEGETSENFRACGALETLQYVIGFFAKICTDLSPPSFRQIGSGRGGGQIEWYLLINVTFELIFQFQIHKQSAY